MPELEPGALLGVADVARLLNLSRKAVYAKVAKGTLPPPIRLPALRWRRSDIEHWLASNSPPSGDPLGDLLRRAAALSRDERVARWLRALADAGKEE
jgi:predicted DNA-binding transcriptional regulator AlpA